MSLLSNAPGLNILGSLLSVSVAVAAVTESAMTPLIAGVTALVVTLGLFRSPSSVTTAQRTSDEGGDEYEILDKIGEGGMGEVFRARQTQLGRLVALKRIKASGLSSEERARFKKEAKVLSGLFSPHTINVFDAGIQRDRTLFYVMELLDGLDLRRLVERNGAIEPARVIHILRQATLSLAEAHQQGLVHRDLKPANLMVCRYGGEFDFVKVLDFGLVKGGRVEEGVTDSITYAGELPGTPAFIAPESVSGKSFVDARADLYSLGALGHYLLTARYLFEADSPIAMVRAQIHDEPSLASERSPFDVPRDLDLLIQKCLEKNPDHRFQSAEEMFTTLEALSVRYPWTRLQAQACWREVPAPSERPTVLSLPSDSTRPPPFIKG